MASSENTAIRLVVADDHEVLRDGFHTLCRKVDDITLVGEASNGEELISQVRTTNPDIAIVDVNMPVLDGIEATKYLADNFPHVGVIAFTMFDQDNLIIDMLEAGASGYLVKNARKEEILSAIRTVNQGGNYYCKCTSHRLAYLIGKSRFNPHTKVKKSEFTEKEIQVIRLICQELTNKEIATRLDLSVRTVEGYREKIQEKMNVKNSAGIVVNAIKKRIYVP